MKVIAIANRKGGVGKTTMSAHIAAGLATQGYKVGLVDTDFQGHSALLLKMTPYDGLHDFLVEKKPLEECVQYVPIENYSVPDNPSKGHLFLLASSDKTPLIAGQLHPEDIDLFHDRLHEFIKRAQLDVVIVDTAPSATELDSNIYLAADAFVFVTEIGKLSFDGLTKLENQVARSKRLRQRMLGKETYLVGIVPNKFRIKTILHRENLDKLKARYGEQIVWNPIPLGITWEESAEMNQTVYIYAPGSVEAELSRKMTERVQAFIGQPKIVDGGKNE